MNRLSFLKLMGLGAVAAVVAPQVLIPKEEVTITWSEPIVTDFTELLAMQKSMMESIANIPVSQLGTIGGKTYDQMYHINDGWCYSEQEKLAMQRMDEGFQRMFLFGESGYKVTGNKIESFNGLLCNP